MFVRAICSMMFLGQAFIAWQVASNLEENRLAIFFPMAAILWLALYSFQYMLGHFATRAIRQNRLDEQYFQWLGDELMAKGLMGTIGLGVLGGIGAVEILSATVDSKDLAGNLIVGSLLGTAIASLLPFMLTPLWGPEVPNQAKKLLKEKPVEPDPTRYLLFRRSRQLDSRETALAQEAESLTTREQQLQSDQQALAQAQAALQEAQQKVHKTQAELLEEAKTRASKNQELLDFQAQLDQRQASIPGLEQQALARVAERNQQLRGELEEFEAGLTKRSNALDARENEITVREQEQVARHTDATSILVRREQTLNELDLSLRQTAGEQEAQANALAQRAQELDTLQQERDATLLQRVAAADQRQTALDQQAEQLREQAQGLEKRDLALRQEQTRLEQVQAELTTERQLLEADKLDLEAKKQKLANDLARLQEDQTNFAPDMEALADAKKALDNLNSAVERREGKLAADQTTLEQAQQRLKTDRAALRQDREALDAEKKQLATDRAELQRQQAQLVSDKTNLNERQTKLYSDVRALSEQSATLSRNSQEFEASVTAGNTALETRRKEVEQQLQAGQQELAARQTEVEKQLADGLAQLETREREILAQIATQTEQQQASVTSQVVELGEAATTLESLKAKLKVGIKLLTNEEPEDSTLEQLMLRFILVLHRKLDEILVAFSGDEPEVHDYPSIELGLSELPEHLATLTHVAELAHEISTEHSKTQECPSAVFKRRIAAADSPEKLREVGKFLLGIELHIAATILADWAQNAQELPIEGLFGVEADWDEKTLTLIGAAASNTRGLVILSAISNETLHNALWSHISDNLASNLAAWILADVVSGNEQDVIADLHLVLRLTSHDGPEFDHAQHPHLGELTIAILALRSIHHEGEHPLAACLRIFSGQEAGHVTALQELASKALLLAHGAALTAYSGIPVSDDDDGFDENASAQLHALMLTAWLNGMNVPLGTTRIFNGAQTLPAVTRGALITSLERAEHHGAAAVALTAPNGQEVLPYIPGSTMYRLLNYLWNLDNETFAKPLATAMSSWDLTPQFLNGSDLFRLFLVPICGFAASKNPATTALQLTIQAGCRDIIIRHHGLLVNSNNPPKVIRGSETACARLTDALSHPDRVTKG